MSVWPWIFAIGILILIVSIAILLFHGSTSMFWGIFILGVVIILIAAILWMMVPTEVVEEVVVARPSCYRPEPVCVQPEPVCTAPPQPPPPICTTTCTSTQPAPYSPPAQVYEVPAKPVYTEELLNVPVQIPSVNFGAVPRCS